MPDDNWRPTLTRIEDPIADDHWKYTTPEGKRRVSRVTVGRPTHYPQERIWYCPVMIEGHLSKITPVFGQGPVDALLNAMNLVRAFIEMNADFVAGAKPMLATRKRSRSSATRTARPEGSGVQTSGTARKSPDKRPRRGPV